jgi:hypothetical protein
MCGTHPAGFDGHSTQGGNQMTPFDMKVLSKKVVKVYSSDDNDAKDDRVDLVPKGVQAIARYDRTFYLDENGNDVTVDKGSLDSGRTLHEIYTVIAPSYGFRSYSKPDLLSDWEILPGTDE